MVRRSPPTATARRSSRPITTGAPRRSARLRGMFAFALWDTERAANCSAPATRSASSHCSCRPGPAEPRWPAKRSACWTWRGTLGIDLGIDERAVQHYTVLQYVPEPETLHRGIRRLESGCYAVIRPGQAPEVTRYFRRGSPPCRSSTEANRRRYDEITAVAARTRWPSTCAPTSRWARSCPAVSTRRRSRHWRSGTIRGLSRSRPGLSAKGFRRSTSRSPRPRRSAPGTCRRWSALRSSSRRCPRSSGTSTNRWPIRRWCRCSSLPARRASMSRWCCPGRVPTSCSADTRSIGNRCH